MWLAEGTFILNSNQSQSWRCSSLLILMWSNSSNAVLSSLLQTNLCKALIEWIGLQRICYFNVYSSWCHACEQHAVTFQLLATLLDCQGPKIVDSTVSKRRSGFHSIVGQLGHTLFLHHTLQLPTGDTFRYRVRYCVQGSNDTVSTRSHLIRGDSSALVLYLGVLMLDNEIPDCGYFWAG